VPTITLHRINRDSALNYHIKEKESTAEMVILLGFTMNEKSTSRMFILTGMIRSGMRNPLDEWDSTGNYQLIYANSSR
jgi:hypothetical protein